MQEPQFFRRFCNQPLFRSSSALFKFVFQKVLLKKKNLKQKAEQKHFFSYHIHALNDEFDVSWKESRESPKNKTQS